MKMIAICFENTAKLIGTLKANNNYINQALFYH